MDESSDKELERYILKQVSFEKLPQSIKSLLENSKTKWKQYIIRYSIRHQLRWKTNLIKTVVPDERNYYQEIIRISRLNFMLYPYHIADVLVRSLRVTAFQYYVEMMLEVMSSEKSYDALPNFTAADCVRVLDIGRNQYIDIMNKCRAKLGLFKNKKKIIRSMLPTKSVESEIDYWWILHLGFITEEDMKNSNELERKTVDDLIERMEKGSPPARAGELNYATVRSLVSRGLVYIEVPIANEDQISVPPLEGFVMNRVLGDYFENLLYKIFVSVDERITIEQLAEVLQIDVELVKHAVSMYIRLGFAKKKNLEPFITAESSGETKWHASWYNKTTNTSAAVQQSQQQQQQQTQATDSTGEPKDISTESAIDPFRSEGAKPGHKRIGFVFDSSLTAFLMMGNLGPGLKSHAVTMFEVGKLAEEMLDDFMTELDKVKVEDVGEGEARRYADHALTLAQVLKFLRHNPNLQLADSDGGVDLLRCERMNSLEETTRLRIINKNYAVMVSMAPISPEANPVTSCIPPHFGSTISEVNSVWFKLFLYHNIGAGPTSMLIPKGTRLKTIPELFQDCERVSMYAWDHDTFTQGTYHALPIINDYLLTSPILIQSHSYTSSTSTATPYSRNMGKLNRNKYAPPTIDVPFPLDECATDPVFLEADEYNEDNMHTHPTVQKIEQILGLQYTCGFIRMQKIEGRKNSKPEWVPLDVYFGIPIFNSKLNKQVLERIGKKQLFNEENLKKQSKNSRKLALRLLDFIARRIQVQDYTKYDRTPVDTSHVDIGSVVPLPTHSLTFVNGVLS